MEIKIIALLQLEELLLLCYFEVAFQYSIHAVINNVAYLASDKLKMYFLGDIFLILPQKKRFVSCFSSKTCSCVCCFGAPFKWLWCFQVEMLPSMSKVKQFYFLKKLFH